MFNIKKEEEISFYSHLIGVIFFIFVTFFLTYTAKNLSLKILSLVYGLSAVILFSASSLYHKNKKYEDEKSIWRKLDHIAIFIMIAGTYTPISFIYLEGYWKWSIMTIQWALVLGGIFFKFFYINAPRILYTIIYISMGWMGILPIHKFIKAMPKESLFLMIAGGISYTVGAVFYIFKKPEFTNRFGFHEIFHIFILLGAIFHFFMVYIAVV
ncbi:MAG: PAQR family membrane homeostasis protein TrhA [Bacillota bacterium]